MKLSDFAKAVNNGDQVKVDAWFYAILAVLASVGAVQLMEEFREGLAKYRAARYRETQRALKEALFSVQFDAMSNGGWPSPLSKTAPNKPLIDMDALRTYVDKKTEKENDV